MGYFCGRWLENGKVVECFLGIGQMKVQITELDRKSFIQGVYNPYIQSVKHLEWNDLV